MSRAFLKTALASVICLALGVSAVNGQLKQRTYQEPPKMTIDANKTYTATIETAKGTIVMDLFPKEAPITVNNFVFLSRDGFYDGLKFHRVEDWVIQGGDPEGTGGGGPGYQIKNEAKSNTHKHQAGTVAMARTADPDSAGSQFYILRRPAPHLDGSYTIFGQVTQGMDSVNKMASNDTIKSVKIEEK